MPPEGIALFIFCMTGLVGTFILIGARMKLNAGNRERLGITQEDFDRVTDAVDQLTDQVATLTVETNELHERIDFTERMLTESKREIADTPA